MKTYSASVKYEGKIITVTREFQNKKAFAEALRANGMKVRFIATPDDFEEAAEKYAEKLEIARGNAQIKREVKRELEAMNKAYEQAKAEVLAKAEALAEVEVEVEAPAEVEAPNKMTYYWANGEVVARSYKHFFDRGARFESKDAVTNLHHFCTTSHRNFSDSNDIASDIAYQVQELVEEYGSISVTVEDYR